MHSKQWHYSLHRDFQNCYSTRRSLTRFFSSNSSSNATHAHYTTIQRILHPESNSTRRRQKSSSSTTTTFQRAKRPSFQKRNSTHRRQGDLLEIHPCVLQDILGNSSCSRDIPDIPVIHDLPAFPGNCTMFQYLQGIHPIPALEYIFYNPYSSIGFHRKLHRVPVGQLQTLQTFILQRKGDVAISVKLTDSPE